MVEFYVEPNTTTIPLGRQGENLARTIYFELSELISNYGDGTATLVYLRSRDSAPYVCDTTQSGNMLSWTPTDTDTAYAGAGKCELRWVVGETLAKSIVYRTSVTESITGDSTVPSEYESWYEALLEHISEYEIASDQIEANTRNIATNTNDIAVLNGRVDEITTLPEGSTTGDAELADIRVGADGTVYSNAGEAVRTQIADVKSAFNDITRQTYNLVSYILKGLTVNASGGMANYGGTTDMVVAPVTSGKTYTIKTDDNSNFVGAFYEQKPTASTTASYNSQRIVSGPKTFTAPITGFVAFRTTNGYAQAQMVEGDSDKAYIPPLSAVDLVARQTLDTITTTAHVTEPVTGVVTDNKTMGVNGTERDVPGWEYETFQCAEGESYTVITYAGQYMDVWIVFDSSNHYVAFSQLPATTPIGRQEKTFTVPAGGVKFCVNNRKADGSISVVKNLPGGEKTVNPNMVLIDDVPLPDVLAMISGENLLYGKTLCCCGDSITYGADMDAEGFTDESNCIVYQSGANGNFTETTSNFRMTWNWQIAERNRMTLYNAGVSGSTMQGLADKNGFSLANGRYTKLPDNIDYLLLWFGWNDTAYGTLGTITDTTNESFYGGYNVVLPYLINKYPYAKIGIIVPFGCDVAHREAVRLIGNKWGIAVWDNYKGGTPLYYGKEPDVGVDSSIVTANQAKFQANGAHPNFKGHTELGHMIENWMRGM